MKLKAAIPAAALSLALAGCAGIEFTSPDAMDGIEVKGAGGPIAHHVVIDVEGMYFMWSLPLWSGDITWNPSKRSIEGGITMFSDMVGLDELQTALSKLAESRDCDLADVTFNDTDASFAGPSYGGIIGSLFGSSHMSVSATLVPRNTKEVVQ